MIARNQEWKRRASLPSPNPAYIRVGEYKFDKSWFSEGFGHVQTKFSPTGEFVVFFREDGNTLRIKYQTHNGKRKCWDEKPVLEDPGQYFRGWQDMTEEEFKWVQAYIEKIEKVAEEMERERTRAILDRLAENTGTTTPVVSSCQVQGRVDASPIQLHPRRTYSIKRDPNNPPPPGVDITAVYPVDDSASSLELSRESAYELGSGSGSELEPDSPDKKRKRVCSKEILIPVQKKRRLRSSGRAKDIHKPSALSSSSSTRQFVQSAVENLRSRNRTPLDQKTNSVAAGPSQGRRTTRGRGKPKSR